MNEDYVSYELALKLKECGFDWRTDHLYRKDADNGNQYTLIRSGFDNYNGHWSANDWCSAPLLYHAQKWLREEKGIDVLVYSDNEKTEGSFHYGYGWEIYTTPSKDNGATLIVCDEVLEYQTYEQALSAGIAAALELIEQEKK